MKTIAFLLWLLLALPAAAAPNVTPQTATWLESNTVVDIRLIGPATATNLAPTVKLFSNQKVANLNAQSYFFTPACWNTASACPKVVGVTVQVFLTLPTGRSNVTKYTGLCNATTCVLPSFPEIQAKPGESYSFDYSRIKADWNVPPSVISADPAPAPTPTPTPTGISVSAVRVVDIGTPGTVLFALTDGMTVDLASFVSARASLDALTTGSPAGVQFTLDGVLLNVEGGAPWMSCGDWNPCPKLWTVGSHTLVVAPGGGTPLTIRYTVK